jgi:hypothetical protein
MPADKMTSSDTRHQQVKRLRISVFVCLVITSFAFAFGAYRIVDSLEEDLQHQLYKNVASEFEAVTLKSIYAE